MKLSVCMIVKNEESILHRCLSQLNGIADELIVVDTGSSDNTKKIAAEFTENLYDFTWIDDFAAARNASFSYATGEYILWLDADDILTGENQKKLMELKRTLPSQYQGVCFPYDMYENGALISSFPRLRMVRRDAGFFWRGRIHETLDTDKSSAGNLFYADIRIGQNVKPKGASGRYLAILKNIVGEENGKDLRHVFYYASELEKHADTDAAILEFERYFKNGGLLDFHCTFACIQLGTLYEKTGAYQKALSLYADCMQHCGQRAEYCCQLGNFYAAYADDPAEAAFWYSAALQCPKPEGETVLERYYYYLPHFRLYQIFDAAGERKSAEEHFVRACEYMKKLEI